MSSRISFCVSMEMWCRVIRWESRLGVRDMEVDFMLLVAICDGV